MLKPKLQNSALPSTAISKNMLSNSYVATKQASMKPSMRESYYSSVRSFHKSHLQPQQPLIDQKQQSTYQNKFHSNSDGSLWTNTSDIESVIRRRIDTDAELSVERNLDKQRYSLGADRICAQKMLSIPQEIRSTLEIIEQQQQQSDKQLHLVYGYLPCINSVYYIIEEDLYVFSMEELRMRGERKNQLESSNLKWYTPTKLRVNCRRIYDIQFPHFHSLRMIPTEFNGRVLILEYPYYIQLCGYSVDVKCDRESQRQNHLHQYQQSRKFITLINLNVRIPLQTVSAEFITVTPKGQLLYLDEKGKVVCFQLSKQDDTKLRRKTHIQSAWKKKTFISRNRSFLRAAKTYFWQALDFRHSLFLSRRKNLSMIYDDRRNRIYTLTIHGDRTTMIQKLRKELKVYEFLNTENKVELNCIMSVPEEELLTEFGIEAQKSPTNLFTILKSEADYNQQSDLIALLSNGTKVHIQFTEQKLKVVSLSICPDIESLRKSSKQRKQKLTEISKDFTSRDQISKMQRELSEKIEIKRSLNGQLRVKAYFNDRGLSIGLVRVDRQYSMYMTIKKAMGSSDQFDVFPIEWRNKNVFQDIEKFPTENEIFAISNKSNESPVMQQISNVQKLLHTSKLNTYERQYRTPRPKSDNCHQLLRQVHHGPHGFVYLSNKFITNFSLLRPIDIVEMMVVNREEAFCEMYLPLILGLEPYEICCMLIQLYCCKEGTYYCSKNYKYKINALIDRLKQNAQRIHSISEKSVLSRISLSNQLKSSQQQIFQEKQDDKLQTTTYSEKILQGNKGKFRKQFVLFSKLQQIKDPNPFQKIKLNFQTVSMSSALEDKIDKLNEEHRCQAQNCLLYLSRVLYPFWTAKITSKEVSKYALRAIKQKILETFGIVELLQVEFNEYWRHFQAFVTKLVQIIEMFSMLSQLPPELTLEEAVSKDPTYFQPYIFMMLKRETNPQMIKLFQHRCPIYVSLYFETLIKVYSEIKITANLQQIQSILGRLPQYPDYFLDFLKEEKGFKDLSFLRMKNDITPTVMRLKIPDLPLQNLIPYLLSRVKNTSVKMNEKFLYLKEARKKMNSCKSPQMRKVQIFSPYVLEKFEKQYDSLLKCLKFQQMCKNQIIRILQEASEENKHSENGQGSGFFSKMLSKLSFGSKSEKGLNQKRLSLIAKRESMNKIQNQNQQIFRKLNYFALQKQELKGLIGQIACPKLNIVYSSIFSPRGINEDEKRLFRRNLILHYIELVNVGARKYKVSMQTGQNQRQNFSKLLNFIRSEVKEIYMCLNATQTFLSFGSLYQGIKQQLINYEDILTSILQNDVECIFSVGRELIQLGFDRNTVLNDIELGNIHRTLRNQDLQDENQSIFVLKSLVYDLYMGVDAARKFKKQKLDTFLQITKDVIELKSSSLEKHPHYKDFLIKMKEMLFNIINGNCENDMDRRTILEKMISKAK